MNKNNNGQVRPSSSDGRSSAPTTASFGPSFDIQQVLNLLLIIKERWIWGACVGLLAAGVFAFVKMSEVPVYRTDAFLLIESKSEQVIDVEKVIDTSLSGMVEFELENHLRKMHSRKFRQSVAESFSVSEAELLTRAYKNEGKAPSVSAIVFGNVQISRENQIYRIVASHLNPEAAALLANRFMGQYINSTIARSWTGNESARTFLEKQSEELKKKIESAERQLTQYRTTHNLVSLEENQNIIVSRLKTIDGQHTATRIEQLQLESAVSQVEDAMEAAGDDKGDLSLEVAEELTEIPYIAGYGAIDSILSRRKGHQADMAALGLRYLERHPEMVKAAEQLEQIDSQLIKEVGRAIRDLRNKKESIDRNIARLVAELKVAEEEALALDRQAVEYNVVKRQLESDRATFDSLINRLNETNLSAELDTTNLRILDEAIVPGAPSNPNPKKISMMAGFIFFACFAGIPFVVELADSRLKSAYDVESFIGKPLLADLPYIKAIEKQEIAPNAVLEDSDEAITEGFRSAYSGLHLHSHASIPKVMLITSTRPSEGKTFVASNLAASMAQHGMRTLLVDADFRRPTLHRHFELRNDKGIIPYFKAKVEGRGSSVEGGELSGKKGILADPNLEIREIGKNLDFLRAGGSTKRTTELIDSDAFEELIHALRAEYDIILLDTPPVSIFTDALFLAEFAEEVIYVARYNKISRQKVRQYVNKLDGRHPSKVTGVIINSRTSSKGQRYGYDSHTYSYYSADYKYYKKYSKEDPEDKYPKTSLPS